MSFILKLPRCRGEWAAGVSGRGGDCGAERMPGSLGPLTFAELLPCQEPAVSCVRVVSARKTTLPSSVPRATLSPAATRRRADTARAAQAAGPVKARSSAPAAWGRPPGGRSHCGEHSRKDGGCRLQWGQEVARAGSEVPLRDRGRVSGTWTPHQRHLKPWWGPGSVRMARTQSAACKASGQGAGRLGKPCSLGFWKLLERWVEALPAGCTAQPLVCVVLSNYYTLLYHY